MNTDFITSEIADQIEALCGTPAYAYDASLLTAQAQAALAFPNAYGLTVRYAMKAAPNAAILKLFAGLGLHIDASSGWEVRRAILAGITPERISLSTQEMPADFAELAQQGILFNACSFSQLECYGQLFPGTDVGVRFNPGLGSGGTGKTNVGGPSSSFGIWHEWADKVQAILEKYKLRCVRIHSHIGSGSDPAVWLHVIGLNLQLVEQFSDVQTLNLGGGYKVARIASEKATDLQEIGTPMKKEFESFAEKTGRKLHLEIEPGTFLVANAAALVTRVQDVVTTGGAEGRNFLKLNSGMTEILRPCLYAAQHTIKILSKQPSGGEKEYVIVGHCCESGDLLTPTPADAEELGTRTFGEVKPGDYCILYGAGAYCSSMSAKNYNSFPEAPEVLLTAPTSTPTLIRKPQTLEQILANEVWRGGSIFDHIQQENSTDKETSESKNKKMQIIKPKPKQVYATSNNQERLVIQLTDGKITYVSRGGNVGNDWNQIQECKLDTFTNAVKNEVKRTLDDQTFKDVLKKFKIS